MKQTKRLLRLAANRERARQRIRTEGEEETAARHERMRKLAAARRANESQEEKEERRLTDRERYRARRISDSQEVSQTRLGIMGGREPVEPPQEDFKPASPLPQQVSEAEKLLFIWLPPS